MSVVKKPIKYPPRFIAACDTASVNFLIAFLDITNFDCYLSKHNFKINNPEFKTSTIQDSLYEEVLEYHKDFLDRTIFFTIETNHWRVKKEVDNVYNILRALLKGRYGDMPQHIMTGADVRSSYNIPSNKSHRARKDMSGDSNILSYDQTLLLYRAYHGKIDDAQDAVNLAFAAYRKFYLRHEGVRPGQWKKIKVQDILLHMRRSLLAQKEKLRQLKSREYTPTIDVDDLIKISPVVKTKKSEVVMISDDEPEIKKMKMIKITKKKKTGPICRFAGIKKKKR